MDKAALLGESIDFLHRYTMKSLQRQAEEHGVTIPQVRVIGEVFAHQPVSIKLLSQNLKMTQSTVSDIVERLVSKDVLKKSPNAKDKRLVDITLSSRLAKDIDDSISQLKNQSLRAVLDLMTPDEQEIAEQGINVLVTAVQKQMVAEGMDDYDYPDILYFPGSNEKK